MTLFFLQNWLIFPGAGTQGHADAVVHAGPYEQVLDLRAADGTKIAAMFGGALSPSAQLLPDAAARPTLLYCYGNGMCMADCAGIFYDLRMLGFNVIVPEYEGYGMSGGRAGEKGCYAAADAAYDWLTHSNAVDRKRIVAAGWSLGAAVAFDLATRQPVAGLASFSAFTSMADMGRLHYPLMPISLLLRHRFDNLSKISKLNCPILLVHGSDDDVIPPKMSDRLAAAAGASVQRITIPNARHNDLFDVGGQKLLQQVRVFVVSLPPAP